MPPDVLSINAPIQGLNAAIMARKLALRQPAPPGGFFSPIAPRRSISSLARASRRPSPMVLQTQRIALPRPLLLQSFRRPYAEGPQANVSAEPKAQKRFPFFRWLWRITYLSAAGGLGWLAYSIWELRNPAEQFAPDPNKKTLVILGESMALLR